MNLLQELGFLTVSFSYKHCPGGSTVIFLRWSHCILFLVDCGFLLWFVLSYEMGVHSAGFLILWECFNDQDMKETRKTSFTTFVKKKMFAQVLNNTSDIPLSQLPSPYLKGDLVFVHIPKEAYLAELEKCKNHLHGRIVFVKEDKPRTHLDVCKKLNLAWKFLDS